MYRTLCLDFKQCYDNPLIEPRGIIMRDHYLEFLWREFLYEGKLKSHYYDSNKYLVIVLMYYSLLRSQSEALLNPKTLCPIMTDWSRELHSTRDPITLIRSITFRVHVTGARGASMRFHTRSYFLPRVVNFQSAIVVDRLKTGTFFSFALPFIFEFFFRIKKVSLASLSLV